jgi:hypothetical protein
MKYARGTYNWRKAVRNAVQLFSSTNATYSSVVVCCRWRLVESVKFYRIPVQKKVTEVSLKRFDKFGT